MDSQVELHLRRLIFDRLADVVAENGVITRSELEQLRVGDQHWRIIDRAYDYRTGSTDGDNRRMRRGFELGLPIILLRTIRRGIFVPIFPSTSSPTILAERFDEFRAAG